MTTMISVRMDKELAKEFSDFCTNAGITKAAAINMFAKATVKSQRIPFEVTGDPFLSDENMQHLLKVKEDLDAGKGIEHELIEV